MVTRFISRYSSIYMYGASYHYMHPHPDVQYMYLLHAQYNRCCMYLCTHTHTIIYLCTHTHTIIYLCTHTHTIIYLCIHTHSIIYLCTHTHSTWMHTDTFAHTHTLHGCTQIPMHMYTHHMDVYRYPCTQHGCTHTHTAWMHIYLCTFTCTHITWMYTDTYCTHSPTHYVALVHSFVHLFVSLTSFHALLHQKSVQKNFKRYLVKRYAQCIQVYARARLLRYARTVVTSTPTLKGWNIYFCCKRRGRLYAVLYGIYLVFDSTASIFTSTCIILNKFQSRSHVNVVAYKHYILFTGNRHI